MLLHIVVLEWHERQALDRVKRDTAQFFSACIKRDFKAAERVLKTNPSVATGRIGPRGESVLHLVAMAYPEPTAALLLLEHGADVNAINADGRTPLQFAETRKHVWVIRALRLRKASRGPGMEPSVTELGFQDAHK